MNEMLDDEMIALVLRSPARRDLINEMITSVLTVKRGQRIPFVDRHDATRVMATIERLFHDLAARRFPRVWEDLHRTRSHLPNAYDLAKAVADAALVVDRPELRDDPQEALRRAVQSAEERGKAPDSPGTTWLLLDLHAKPWFTETSPDQLSLVFRLRQATDSNERTIVSAAVGPSWMPFRSGSRMMRRLLHLYPPTLTTPPPEGVPQSFGELWPLLLDIRDGDNGSARVPTERLRGWADQLGPKLVSCLVERDSPRDSAALLRSLVGQSSLAAHRSPLIDTLCAEASPESFWQVAKGDRFHGQAALVDSLVKAADSRAIHLVVAPRGWGHTSLLRRVESRVPLPTRWVTFGQSQSMGDRRGPVAVVLIDEWSPNADQGLLRALLDRAECMSAVIAVAPHELAALKAQVDASTTDQPPIQQHDIEPWSEDDMDGVWSDPRPTVRRCAPFRGDFWDILGGIPALNAEVLHLAQSVESEDLFSWLHLQVPFHPGLLERVDDWRRQGADTWWSGSSFFDGGLPLLLQSERHREASVRPTDPRRFLLPHPESEKAVALRHFGLDPRNAGAVFRRPGDPLGRQGPIGDCLKNPDDLVPVSTRDLLNLLGLVGASAISAAGLPITEIEGVARRLAPLYGAEGAPEVEARTLSAALERRAAGGGPGDLTVIADRPGRGSRAGYYRISPVTRFSLRPLWVRDDGTLEDATDELGARVATALGSDAPLAARWWFS